jgi:hypothetical protein
MKHVRVGRPRGKGRPDRVEAIRGYLAMGLSRAAIARLMRITPNLVGYYERRWL